MATDMNARLVALTQRAHGARMDIDSFEAMLPDAPAHALGPHFLKPVFQKMRFFVETTATTVDGLLDALVSGSMSDELVQDVNMLEPLINAILFRLRSIKDVRCYDDRIAARQGFVALKDEIEGSEDEGSALREAIERALELHDDAAICALSLHPAFAVVAPPITGLHPWLEEARRSGASNAPELLLCAVLGCFVQVRDDVRARLASPSCVSSPFWDEALAYIDATLTPLMPFCMALALFRDAVSKGKTVVCRALLQAYHNLRESDVRGDALAIAAEHGHEGIVHTLLSFGDPTSCPARKRNVQGLTALMVAAAHKQASIARQLLQRTPRDATLFNDFGTADSASDTALAIACRLGYEDVVGVLLGFANFVPEANVCQAPGAPDCASPLMAAVGNGHTGVVAQLLAFARADRIQRLAFSGGELALAMRMGFADIVGGLVSSDTFPAWCRHNAFEAADRGGNTPLMLAARYGHADAAAALLSCLSMSDRARVLGARNAAGQTAQHLAAAWGFANVEAALARFEKEARGGAANAEAANAGAADVGV